MIQAALLLRCEGHLLFSVAHALSPVSISPRDGRTRPWSSGGFLFYIDRLSLILTQHARRFIYMLILAQDANFHLKSRLRSSDIRDPTLGPGWAYFVDNGPYLRHVAKYANQDEVSYPPPLNILTFSSYDSVP